MTKTWVVFFLYRTNCIYGNDLRSLEESKIRKTFSKILSYY